MISTPDMAGRGRKYLQAHWAVFVFYYQHTKGHCERTAKRGARRRVLVRAPSGEHRST
jgi:hypothetical protein